MADHLARQPVAAAAASPTRGRPTGDEGPSLSERVVVTLLVLLVWRGGSFIPIPGIDPQVVASLFAQPRGGVLEAVNAIGGGAIGRMSIFALGLIPYVTAAILMLLAYVAIPAVARLGRGRVDQIARYIAVVLAAFQGYGIASGLEGIGGIDSRIVLEPGSAFRIGTAGTLVAGTVFLIWLCDQITRRGVGNGIAVLIAAGLVSGVPGTAASLVELGRQGAIATAMLQTLVALYLLVVASVVGIALGRRRLAVHARQQGPSDPEAEGRHLGLPLASAAAVVPLYALSAAIPFAGVPTMENLLYAALQVLIVTLVVFLTGASAINPKRIAENIAAQGLVMPSVRPGQPLAVHIDQVASRIGLFGAFCLALLSIVPDLVVTGLDMSAYLFRCMSVVIVTLAAVDVIADIRRYREAGQAGD